MINIPDIIKVQGKIRGYANLKKTAIYVKDVHEQIYSCYTSKKVKLGKHQDKVNIIGERIKNNKIRISYIENTTQNHTHYLLKKEFDDIHPIPVILILILVALFVILLIALIYHWYPLNMGTTSTLFGLFNIIIFSIVFLVSSIISTVKRENQIRQLIEHNKNLRVNRNISKIHPIRKELETNKNTNYCSECGLEMTSKIKYCSYCGNKI